MIKAHTSRSTLGVAAAAVMILTLSPQAADAGAIWVVNSTPYLNNTDLSSYTTSFNAGATADKLILTTATESAANITGITYDGNPLSVVPDTTGGNNRSRGIWYLDLAGTGYTGGAANITVSGDGTFTSMALGIVSIAGSAAGYDVGNLEASTSVSLNVANDGSFVMAAYTAQGDGNTPSAVSPLTPLFGNSPDSMRAAAGYQNNVSSGVNAFSFNSTSTLGNASAAAFTDVHTGRTAIGNLFNTGVDAGGNVVASGTGTEIHYTLSTVPAGESSTVRVAKAADGLPGSWLGDSTTSRWIGPDTGAANLNNAEGGAGVLGDYVADTTFTLPNDVDLSSVIITGRWATDNGGLDILLNGNSLVASGDILSGEVSGSFGAYTNFSFGPGVSYFQTGVNTLSFKWNNSAVGFTGLRVDNLAGSYNLVVIPAPAALPAGLAMLGLIAARRRR